MMEEPELIMPRVLSPCSSGRRGRSSTSGSPEFEFWMVGNGNQTFPQPELLSADELFSDGVLLPLYLLQSHPSEDPSDQKVLETPAEPEASGSGQHQTGSDLAGDSALVSASPAPVFSSSRRWKDIFKINGDPRSSKGSIGNADNCSKGKEKKKEKKIGGGGGGGQGLRAAELNINIWPFSRSRSAGNGGSRPRVSSGSTRKVSSAPCSRSNSSSESKSNRKWPSSPGRAGIHLGRSSPVWQVRPRSSAAVAGPAKSVTVTVNGDTAMKNVEKGQKKDLKEVRRKVSPSAVPAAGGPSTAKAKSLTLNVPMCIGYRHRLSCRSDENGSLSVVADAGAGGEGGGADEGVRGGNLFSIRSLFTKRVH